jgi:multidrug transporter EmrE-like cation transporter
MADWTNVLSLTALSTVGDIGLKGYSLGNNQNGLILGLGCYGGVVLILSKILGTDGIAYTNNMWNAGTSIVETAVGVWTGEPFTNTNLVGVGMIIVGAMFLNHGRNR